MMWIIFGVLTIVFLIIVSAFFSSSEMAFVSINKAVIVDKARKGDKKAKILEGLLKNPDNVISAIVIGNNLVNIFASILAGVIATSIFGNIGIGIATVVMMLSVLIFSEATPKAFGIKNENLALKVARPLSTITKLFHPMVVLLNYISNGLISLLGGKKRETVVTEHEIMAMMRLGEEEGTIEKDEREMVNDVFEFDETHVYEIYTSKGKVEFIHESDTIEDLIQKSIKTGFSRFPTYGKDLNDIVGMVHVKDSLIIEDTSLQVKNIMRKILKIDSSMKIDDVLREMKRNNTHLALLQDRDGKTLGLVSMEDLIEEIFGEISDEHDVKP
jgi:CBS domain containing-hemolysin-like protein